jgi:hypothetical protein
MTFWYSMLPVLANPHTRRCGPVSCPLCCSCGPASRLNAPTPSPRTLAVRAGRPLGMPMQGAAVHPLRKGFRAGIIGLALVGIGAAWVWHLPVLLGLSLAIRGGETCATSRMLCTLRHGADRFPLLPCVHTQSLSSMADASWPSCTSSLRIRACLRTVGRYTASVLTKNGA